MFRLALLGLLFTTAPVAGEQLTIRCERNGGFDFSTFDTVTKRMIVEVTGGGTYRGQIQAASDSEIQFVLLFPGQMQTNLYYRRDKGRIDVQTDFDRSVTAENCVSAPLRDVLSKWESWGPIPLK
jgi:hypothetical protein